MRTDEELQKDVQEALKWEPMIGAAEIGVIIRNGIVTLTGIVNSFEKKREAENAARKVVGIHAIVDDITVSAGSTNGKEDAKIAEDVFEALNGNLSVPAEKVTIIVEDGWITLEGMVDRENQRISAKDSVSFLPGVKGVHNKIMLKEEVLELAKKEYISKVLKRHKSINCDLISIKVKGHCITMEGYVNSAHESTIAGKAALKTPGVQKVVNKLQVRSQALLAKKKIK